MKRAPPLFPSPILKIQHFHVTWCKKILLVKKWWKFGYLFLFSIKNLHPCHGVKTTTATNLLPSLGTSGVGSLPTKLPQSRSTRQRQRLYITVEWFFFPVATGYSMGAIWMIMGPICFLLIWGVSWEVFLVCFWGDTVDGWNPAPPGMYETLRIMG